MIKKKFFVEREGNRKREETNSFLQIYYRSVLSVNHILMLIKFINSLIRINEMFNHKNFWQFISRNVINRFSIEFFEIRDQSKLISKLDWIGQEIFLPKKWCRYQRSFLKLSAFFGQMSFRVNATLKDTTLLYARYS